MCAPLQLLAHVGKGLDMAFCRPFFINKDRIIAPAHTIRTDNPGKEPEGMDDLRLFRNIRFNVFSVGRDRHKPVLMVGLQQVHLLQHRLRIFAAENDQVDHGRIQPVSGDGKWIEGISHENKAFLQAVGKPLRIEGRYVCAVSGLYDHT